MPTNDSWLTVRDGHLCFDGADIVAVAGDAETPFYLFSERRLRHNIAGLQEVFGGRCPRTEIFYASKACSNLWFLNVVRDSGINVEVNAGGELDNCLLYTSPSPRDRTRSRMPSSA